jgi:hypothetical protein
MDRLLDVYGRETGGNETTPMTSREVTSAWEVRDDGKHGNDTEWQRISTGNVCTMSTAHREWRTWEICYECCNRLVCCFRQFLCSRLIDLMC